MVTSTYFGHNIQHVTAQARYNPIMHAIHLWCFTPRLSSNKKLHKCVNSDSFRIRSLSLLLSWMIVDTPHHNGLTFVSWRCLETYQTAGVVEERLEFNMEPAWLILFSANENWWFQYLLKLKTLSWSIWQNTMLGVQPILMTFPFHSAHSCLNNYSLYPQR